MENEQTNLYTPSAAPDGPKGIRLFWQNLSRRQKYIFIVGIIVIVILLVIGFVVSMNMANNDSGANGDSSTEGGSSSSTSSEEGGGENNEEDDALLGEKVDEENYVDATKTPIEGGDPNSIDTYLPHALVAEPVSDPETQDDTTDAIWSIELDKNTKEIWLFMHDLEDQGVRDAMEAYLNTIPAELLDGYTIRETEF